MGPLQFKEAHLQGATVVQLHDPGYLLDNFALRGNSILLERLLKWQVTRCSRSMARVPFRLTQDGLIPQEGFFLTMRHSDAGVPNPLGRDQVRLLSATINHISTFCK